MAPTVPIEFTGQKESRKFSLPPMMGKSRKYSKGHSSGFVPDFRHAVETIGESEGFGSSGRVDTEMTVSEDSYAPKRKCISLNADSCDSFVVPMQVLSLSKMSRLERKDLESRLKMELEQVRTLQGKIFSLSSNAVVLSPSSDIRSCSDGKKRPPLESFQRSSEVLAPHGKKRPPAMGRNGSRPKKSKSGHFEPVKLAAPANTSNALLMEKCKTLLDLTRSHQYGWVFNEPVDVVKLKIPDYFTVIKYPMDLGTVKSKIASGGYLSPLEFAADVRLTFSNAMTYNPPGNDVHIMAKTLSKFFEARWKAAEEFRRKAEAEAAAEAKRQRELDREAARQALLKMEKTVDINENGQFMEDLEMLRAAPDEHLQSFTEETSPDHSENVFGSFKLQGSNPLEQLGLYMKDDDDDEEEVEPPKSAPEPANDVEEGEID
ncbi:hypothetical protein I3843_11G010300 [Carya illinoinensis]|uniref:Bromo domain-containing protein n=1 Tax=Carya illinoinensis TaxID=32201 RepID=A0A922DKT5_CARIL|nr:hypothetical protein I3760_11G010400 [Carya illinoinensis]KAG6686309.1 hypothetical protein I3842_11G010500 [Carya illinoinensis]KAG7954313.1 hypothetical protein I3843_11G010300 [Carya illinoinensis]